jgi:enoyl-[acyl-carrier protein] reductase II
MLSMKNLIPVRLLKNKFFEEVKKLEDQGAKASELERLLGHGRAKNGMLLGDMEQGELEIGQIAAIVRDIPSVEELVQRLVQEQRSVMNQGLFF